jgi:hypothetical protein
MELKESDPLAVLGHYYLINHENHKIEALCAIRIRALLNWAYTQDTEGPIKLFIRDAIKEYLTWVSVLFSGISAFCNKGDPEFPRSIDGLTLEDIISYGFVFRAPDLFGNVKTIWVARGTLWSTLLPAWGPRGFRWSTCPNPNTRQMCLWSGVCKIMQDFSLTDTDIVRQESITHVRSCVKHVSQCVCKDFATIQAFTEERGSGTKPCKNAQTKLGAFLYWFLRGGLNPAMPQNYSSS